MASLVGSRVERKEDKRFLTGKGRYTSDINIANQTYAIFIRSPHARAKIKKIDTSKALKSSGVVEILTGEHIAQDKIGGLIAGWAIRSEDGSEMKCPANPPLAKDSVNFVGDPVAVVFAETLDEARAAADLVKVDYKVLKAVSNLSEAMNSEAIHDGIEKNLCYDWLLGDRQKVKEAFEKADKIIKLDINNNRLIPNAMEPRACVIDYNTASEEITCYTTSQNPHLSRLIMSAFGGVAPENKLRVVAPDVGGGFGSKINLYNEEIVCSWASKKIERPIKWVAERTESFLTDTHGRDHITHAELAVTNDGKFLGFKNETIANLGAYARVFGTVTPTYLFGPCATGVYIMPAAYSNVKAVYTNTAPVDAYRGAGRPEASFVIERLVDVAGMKSGLGPIEIRRRNLIPSAEMPYKTALNHTYDSGDFLGNMELAVKDSDWEGFKDRAKISEKNNKIRGIGLSTYIEACSGGGPEEATIILEKNGSITLHIGTQSNGQGHETAYKQILCEYLGIGPENMTVIQGDSDVIAFGAGTGGSRSVPVGGAAIKVASQDIISKAKSIAAQKLNIDESTLEYKEGIFLAEGTNLTISLEDLAKESDEPIKISSQWTPPNYTFPNGCHICELEVDKDTGQIEIKKYTVVDDFGLVINPNMLAGQVHGGIAQGIGQAIYENTIYDDENGQLLSGSFMDYAMPRADDLPFFESSTYTDAPCLTNPLGAKGVGEIGVVGSIPAIANAIDNAVGARVRSLPITPEKIKSAMREA